MYSSVDTEYDHTINLDSIAPILKFNMNKKSIDTFIDIISNCVYRKTNGNKLKQATIYSRSRKQDVLNIEKRLSNRVSLKDKEITDYVLKSKLIEFLNQNTNKFHWSLLEHHYDYVEYEESGFFNKHRDYQWFYSPNTIQMTCLFGLHNCINGGETKIWFPRNYNGKKNESQIYDYTAKKGGIIIFPSHWFHSGLPVNGQKKLLMMTLSCEYDEMKKSPLSKNGDSMYKITYSEILSSVNLNIDFRKKNDDIDINKELKINKQNIEENKYIKLVTSDKKSIKVLSYLLENTNLQIMLQLYGDEYILPYNIQEMNIILRYLSGDNYITIDVLKKKSRDKTYLEILKEIGIIDPYIEKIGLNTKSTTLRLLDKLLNNKIKIGLWSSFKPWMIDFVDKVKYAIPFVIINSFEDYKGERLIIDLYNCRCLKYSYMFSKDSNPRLKSEYCHKKDQNKSLLCNIRSFINHLRLDFAYSTRKSDEDKMSSTYSGDYKYNVPEDMIKDDILIDYSSVTDKFNDIKTNIYQILKNNNELTPKKFNIENWKNSYLKFHYDNYDDDSDYYDDDDDCNGYDEYGGYYKKENSGNEYAKQLITVRYGIYINN